jgi:hypothetical protein
VKSKKPKARPPAARARARTRNAHPVPSTEYPNPKRLPPSAFCFCQLPAPALLAVGHRTSADASPDEPLAVGSTACLLKLNNNGINSSSRYFGALRCWLHTPRPGPPGARARTWMSRSPCTCSSPMLALACAAVLAPALMSPMLALPGLCLWTRAHTHSLPRGPRRNGPRLCFVCCF